MKLISRHIESSVILSISVIIAILLGLHVFIEFVRQFDDIGVGSYNLWRIFQYVVLMLPNSLYQFFPMACLIGSLVGLGRLATNRELIVMRAAGVSINQIVFTVIKAALIIIFVVTLIGEGLAPISTNFAEFQKAVAKSSGQTLKTSHGIWMSDKKTFIHIEKMIPGMSLEGVTQYEFDENHKMVKVSYSKSAFLKHHKWVLQDISETYFVKDAIQNKSIKKRIWEVKINPELLKSSGIEPDRLSLVKLKNLIEYRRKSGLETSEYILGFWQRIMQPFASLIIIFLSIPFVLGPLRTMTMGLRILIGILIGFSFYLLNRFFGSFCLVYQVPPIVGAIFPSFLFLTIGWFSISRVK